MKNKTKISIVGLGYVGLPLCLLADEKGYEVLGVDLDKNKVDLINKKISPFMDEEISKKLKKSFIKATTDFSEIGNSKIIIVCVPTPVYEDHLPNLEPVENACKNIALYLKPGQLVIVESTVNPGVCESIVLPILEEISLLTGGKDFYLAHCPERINPGDKDWSVENIPRVIGSLENIGLKMATDFYRSIISGNIKQMNSLKEAEAVKVVENSFRDINIAFVNELAMSFGRLGIDVVNVIEGASTKPFSFMAHFPGCGVGGHCIPVDPYYLIDYAKKNGFSHDFLKLARQINNNMPKYLVDQTKIILEKNNIPVKKSNILLLGLAYKPEVGDIRESPSLEIIKHFEGEEVNLKIFDPYVLDKSTAGNLEEAFIKIDAVVIATAHNLFKKLSPQYFLDRGVKIIIDGRNCLCKEEFLKAGIDYNGIGR